MTALERTGTPANFKPPSLVPADVGSGSTELIMDSFTRLSGSNISANRISETLLKSEGGDTKDLIQQEPDSKRDLAVAHSGSCDRLHRGGREA